MTHNFCCAHPQLRIDSPEPPARPPLRIDGILAAAALPEGHPHALKFPDKKPELDSSIIRSPHITDKIKWQFRKRSTKALRSEEEYDKDAQPMTSTDAIHTLGYTQSDEVIAQSPLLSPRLQPRSVRTMSTPVSMEDYQSRNEVRDSLLRGLGWLRPFLERSSEVLPTQTAEISNVATGVAKRKNNNNNARFAVSFPPPVSRPSQSVSSPNLFKLQHEPAALLRRTQSSLNFGTLLTVPKIRSARNSTTTQSSDTLRQDQTDTPQPENDDTQLPCASSTNRYDMNGEDPDSAPVCEPQHSTADIAYGDTVPTGPHLHTMGISHQLRSLSALSEASDEHDSLLSRNGSWNFHWRSNFTGGGPSNWSGLVRQHSSTAEFVPLNRMRSPAASSNYSRPSSNSAVTPTENDLTGRVLQIEAVTSTLDGACADWPLPMPSTTAATQLEPATLAHEEEAPKLLEPQITTGPDLLVDDEDNAATEPSSPPIHGPLPSKSSSSYMSVSSMRSRFRDRFQPGKKAVHKRRSVFKFLRPGSRKEKTRSVSMPMLRTETPHLSTYDGPSEDPETMIVEYELTENPQQQVAVPRAASTGNMDPHEGAPTFLEVPVTLPQRRPSLADYERILTATGDDRRRPSTLNVQKLQEVQEDDRRQSSGLRRKLSRAKPLNEEPTGLMAQALKLHQEEKAVFRSASKQREEREASRTSLFRTDTLHTDRISLPPSTPGTHNDLLGPLEGPAMKISVGRSQSAGYLLPPGPFGEHVITPKPVTASSPLTITTTSVEAPKRLAGYTSDRGSLGAPPSTRIGTSMSSWTKFPSHTRVERCGSAGPADAVIVHDFAGVTDVTPGDPNDLEAASPVTKKFGKGRVHLPKRRSTTFGGLTRYYSNLFSGANSTQNRRSSIAAGGWLANPDLELLPPAGSHEPTSSLHDHHFKQRLHQIEHDLEAEVAKDVEHVEGEAMKIKQHIRKDVEHGAEKLKHMKPHRHPESALVIGPFPEKSPFIGDSQHRAQRKSIFVDPLDDEINSETTPPPVTIRISEERPEPAVSEEHTERGTTLDGTGDEAPCSSKAQLLSNEYQECLNLDPDSTAIGQSATENTTTTSFSAPGSQQIMGPPLLRPAKARAPQHIAGLDPNATVRCYPSVTVVDDRKGHGRSISLISVKLGPDGVMRSSTNDLIEMIQAKEQEERDKLLRGPSRASAATSDKA